MLPTYPERVIPRPCLAAAFASFLVALGLVAPPSARALQVTLDSPSVHEGFLWSGIHIGDAFTTRVEESLSRGMPATLQIHAELWRRRGGWFDKLEKSFDASVRIRYDVWSKHFQIEQRGRTPITVETLDSVRTVLSRPTSIPVAKIEGVRPGPTYYVAIAVTLKPLDVRDIEEGEGWLSGEVQTQRRAGVGVVTTVPRAVLDAVRNFTGFGDLKARAISEDFGIETAPEDR